METLKSETQTICLNHTKAKIQESLVKNLNEHEGIKVNINVVDKFTFNLGTGKFDLERQASISIEGANKLKLADVDNLNSFNKDLNKLAKEQSFKKDGEVGDFSYENGEIQLKVGDELSSIQNFTELHTCEVQPLLLKDQEKTQLIIVTHPNAFNKNKVNFFKLAHDLAEKAVLNFVFICEGELKSNIDEYTNTVLTSNKEKLKETKNIQFYLIPEDHSYGGLLGSNRIWSCASPSWFIFNMGIIRSTFAYDDCPNIEELVKFITNESDDTIPKTSCVFDQTDVNKVADVVSDHKVDLNHDEIKLLKNFLKSQIEQPSLDLTDSSQKIFCVLKRFYEVTKNDSKLLNSNLDIKYAISKKLKNAEDAIKKFIETNKLNCKIEGYNLGKVKVNEVIGEIAKACADCPEFKLSDLLISKNKTLTSEGIKKEFSILYAPDNFNMSSELSTKLKDLQNKLLEANSSFRVFNVIDFTPKLSVGKKMMPIKLAQKVYPEKEGEEESVTITHNPGEVILLDFWATWCGPCQNPMKHNNEMLEKNKEKWGKNVRIIGLGLDTVDALQTRIEEKNWKLVEHYSLDESKVPGHSDVSNMYGVEGIPHVLLVDKSGVITYIGHPSGANLENDINNLLNEGEKSEVSLPVSETKIKKEYKKIADKPLFSTFYHKFCDKTQVKISYKYHFSLQLSKEFEITEELRLKTVSSKLELSYNVRKKEAELLNDIRENTVYDKILPKELITIKSAKVLDTIDIRFGDKCDKCSKALTNTDVQFYCPTCTNVSFCEECSRFDISKNGNDAMPHKHNLVYVNVTNDAGMKEIDLYKIGKNLAFEKDIKDREHGFCCNICNRGSDFTRYLCLTCRPGVEWPGGYVDYCEKCIEVLYDKKNPKYEEYRESAMKRDKHDASTHVYLVLHYNTGYYNY